MRRIFSALLVTAALASPLGAATSALAAEPGAATHIIVRVYDPYRRDYHRWDNREERAYRAYLAQHRRSYVVYRHQRSRSAARTGAGDTSARSGSSTGDGNPIALFDSVARRYVAQTFRSALPGWQA